MERFVQAFSASKHIRDAQYEELQSYLLSNLKDATAQRDRYFTPDHRSEVAYSRSLQKYRADLCGVIGYPPPHEEPDGQVREEALGEDDLCTISRIFIPAAAGLETYGIYLLPRTRKKRTPLMLSLHGGLGCPELICNFDGSTNYNDAARRFVKEGYIVFAPAFSFQPFVDGDVSAIPKDMRAVLDIRAKWIGSSLAAIELFKVTRALDHLAGRPEVDPDHVAVAGLSYGGFYALFLAALDLRIKYCISSCYLCDRVEVNQLHPGELFDWTWKGMLSKFADAELVSLICPRPCIIESGTNDYYIPIDGARREHQRARIHYDKLGIADRLVFVEFEGTHEFHLTEALRSLRKIRGEPVGSAEAS